MQRPLRPARTFSAGPARRNRRRRATSRETIRPAGVAGERRHDDVVAAKYETIRPAGGPGNAAACAGLAERAGTETKSHLA